MLEAVLDALEMLEGMHRGLLCMLEAEGELCLLEVLEVPEVIRYMIFWRLWRVGSVCCKCRR